MKQENNFKKINDIFFTFVMANLKQVNEQQQNVLHFKFNLSECSSSSVFTSETGFISAFSQNLGPDP